MKLFKRENYLKKIRGFYDADDLIKVITGVRRCGKSTLLLTIMDELLENKVNSKNIIYINLEKRGFKSITTPNQLEEVIDEKTSKIKGLKYLFIDEIQRVKGFEDVVNGYRSEGEFSIFITGSNSYLLNNEITTILTGRYIAFEIFPLTFEEYLQMKEFYKKPINNNLAEELTIYIREGGFPRTMFFDNEEDKNSYVLSIIEEIYEKDIKRRVKIKNKILFEKVRSYIINNYGATTNIKSLYKALTGLGYTISEATVKKYIDVLVDAKILYQCDRFDMKSKRSLSGDKKYYLSDLSFYYAMNTDARVAFGSSLENIVYMYAKSKGYYVSVGKIGNFECDFIVRKNSNNYSYIQVTYSIMENREIEEREYRPLETTLDSYPKYLLTRDDFIQQRNGIKHFNIPEFMKKGKLFD